MTIFERFDVVVVPFPFVDVPQAKPRPALVLSTMSFNAANGHTALAMITRAAATRWPSDHPIVELAPTGLKVASVIRWKIFTLDNRIVRRRIGSIGGEDADRCEAALRQILLRQP